MKRMTGWMLAVAMVAMPVVAMAQDIVGSGVVKAVDAGTHTVKMAHEPIAALGWPAMVMNFTVAPEVALEEVKEGDKVRFTLQPVGDEDYRVTKLERE